jgi:hypothetical protein
MGLSNAIRASMLACLFAATGCFMHHEAKVQSVLLPPPSEAPVRHTGRLWVELGSATWETQCRSPKAQRELCFTRVRKATFGALRRGLWTSFPEVILRDGESIPTGDYLLQADVSLDAHAPDAGGPGWSAIASGGYRLSRDGKVLLEEKLGSRSRASFAYGSPLGVGAGEVVDAIAAHIAQSLGGVPEDRPLRPAPLPAVVAETVGPAAPAPVPAPQPASTVTAPASAGNDVPALTAPVQGGGPAEPAAEPPPEPASSWPSVSPPMTPIAAR